MEDETGRRDLEGGAGADGAEGGAGTRVVHSVERTEGAHEPRDPRGSLTEERRERTSVANSQNGESLHRISVLQRVASLQRSSSAQLPRTRSAQLQRTASERLLVQREQNAEMQERAKVNRDRCLISTTLVIAMGLLLVYILYIIFLAS